ncbi:S8 family serine peptidase [Bacteriovoracaceae bacterium]|nr:S8 family serine peptidase [Bacteriovoracaceae bacterium]
MISIIAFILSINCSFGQEFKSVITLKEKVTPALIKSLEKELKNQIYPLTNYPAYPFSHMILTKGPIAHKLVKKIEPIFSSSILSIVPSKSLLIKNEDPLFPYQWGLFNKGQIIYNDITDISLEKIFGIDDQDIGFFPQLSEILLKKKISVAVLDSGIDLDHPELKNKILLNESECENGTLPLKPTVDRDQNGFIGDCMGWNFVDDNERAYDDNGHGTHVAGIIGATSSNGQGIRGFSEQIFILPLKVTSPGSGRGFQNAFSDRIVKAMLYAISRNVDIINISLGWPHTLDTDYMREVFELANQKGIIVVAASGNNNNTSPVYPCAYESVICVGAHNASGKKANFSNYGAHVDFMAPGDNILSTIPEKLTPLFFSINGMDIKNGTSQASPMIAGAAAVIKGLFPASLPNDILRKFIASARRESQSGHQLTGKNSLYGKINLVKAIEHKNDQSMFVPIFKNHKNVIIDSKNHIITIPIKVKNIGKSSGIVTINVDLNDSDYPATPMTSFPVQFKILPGKSKVLYTKWEISDLMADNEIELKTTLSNQEKSFSYISRSLILSKIDQASSSTAVTFPKIKEKKQRRRRGNSRALPPLSSVNDSGHLFQYPVFYTEQSKTKKIPLTIGLYNREQSESYLQHCKIQLPHAIKFFSIEALDLDGDEKVDFLVRSLAVNLEKEKFIQYSYFDGSCKPLFGKYSHLFFKPEVVIQNDRFTSYTFVTLEKPINMTIKVPVFLDQGTTPLKDIHNDPWNPRPNYTKNHIYFLSPVFNKNKGRIELETRIFDTQEWRTQLNERLNIDWNDKIEILYHFPQEKKDKKIGKTSFLLATGKNGQYRFHKISYVGGKESSLTVLHSSQTILGTMRSPLMELNSNRNTNGMLLVGHETQSIAQFHSLLNNHFQSSVYRHPYQRDNILTILAGFVDPKSEQMSIFLQTKNNLVLHQYSSNQRQTYLRKITRFSFLPGVVYNEIFFPVVFGKIPYQTPAVYIDGTQIDGKRIHLIIPKNNRLISPIKFNFELPKNCFSLNPHKIKNLTHFSFLCRNEENSRLKLLHIPFND